jgi:hypothetical protein
VFHFGQANIECEGRYRGKGEIVVFGYSPVSLLTHGWVRLAFSMLLMTLLMLFNSIFYAGITIATNRMVEASHRATLNGLSSVVASIGRGFGPLVAGSLIAFSMTSQSIDPAFGSVLAYSVLTAEGWLPLPQPTICRPRKKR